MSELTDRIMSEAAIASRTGSMLRLQTIAADLTRLQAELDAAVKHCRTAYDRGYREADREWQLAGDGMGLA